MSPGCQWGSTDLEEPIELDFQSLKYNHHGFKAARIQKPLKTCIFNKLLLFLRGFWVLAALNLDGCIPIPEN